MMLCICVYELMLGGRWLLLIFISKGNICGCPLKKLCKLQWDEQTKRMGSFFVLEHKNTYTLTQGLSLSLSFSPYLSLHHTQFLVQCLHRSVSLMLVRPSGDFTYWKFLRTENIWRSVLLPL